MVTRESKGKEKAATRAGYVKLANLVRLANFTSQFAPGRSREHNKARSSYFLAAKAVCARALRCR